jgi:hypothetical protein
MLSRCSRRNKKFNISYDAQKSKLLFVNEEKNIKAEFNMENMEDYMLFGELIAFKEAMRTIQKNSELLSFVKDQYPDLYIFSISALKGIASKYGTTSKYYAAVHILDALLPRFIQTFSKKLYEERAIAQIAVLGSNDEQIDLASAGKRRLLWQYEIQQNNATNNSTSPTLEEMMDYQTAIWSTIIIVVALIFALYALFSIDYSKDTLLYVTEYD